MLSLTLFPHCLKNDVGPPLSRSVKSARTQGHESKTERSLHSLRFLLTTSLFPLPSSHAPSHPNTHTLHPSNPLALLVLKISRPAGCRGVSFVVMPFPYLSFLSFELSES